MDRVHEHLRAYLRAGASLPGGRAHEEDGVLRIQVDIPWPMFNGAVADPAAGREACSSATAALAEAGRPWFLWVLPQTPAHAIDAAAAAGAFQFDAEAPWMEARIADLEDPELPAAVSVVEVSDEAGHRLWAAALREIYEFPEIGEQAWTRPGELCGWRGLPWRQWIAFAGDDPAGVTMLFCGGGVAGLFGVGVKPAFRRRGIGRLLTLLPLKESGETLAGFFATAEGEPLYRGLGFETTGWVSRWLGGMDADPAAKARGGVGVSRDT
jgi:ribosomal protein S18 acetylase RimI-like enzyme